MRAFVIQRSDIDRCPIHSILPSHYRENGDCACPRYFQQTAHVTAGDLAWFIEDLGDGAAKYTPVEVVRVNASSIRLRFDSGAERRIAHPCLSPRSREPENEQSTQPPAPGAKHA